MTPKALTICRVLLALGTILVLVATFYFAALALGFALDASTDRGSRLAGAACALAYVALAALLVGLLPPVRGRPLLWLGMIGTLGTLPFLVGCALLTVRFVPGSVAGLCYLGAWWALAWPKVSPRPIPAKLPADP